MNREPSLRGAECSAGPTSHGPASDSDLVDANGCTHPTMRPTSDGPGSDCDCDWTAEVVASLKLALVPHVGPQLHGRLCRRLGSAQAVLAAPLSAVRAVPGVGRRLAEAIVAAQHSQTVDEELARCRAHHIRLVTRAQPDYPRLLGEIPDPPAILYLQGQLRPQDALSIAIVGTRQPTTYGLRMASRLASSLSAAGLTVVSGLARGIDAAAHRAALEAGGRTVAVLAGGLTQIYPPENQTLAREITRSGCLVSESPCGAPLSPGAFPRRNRLITGLSLGVIVVEAGQRSGALVSARHALEQGREVFAVPGPIDSRVSCGCHHLIRDGARLVQSFEDVLEELGPLVEGATSAAGLVVHHPAELQLNPQEQAILQQIGVTPTLLDSVVQQTGLPVPRVLATISALEIRHLIRRVSGNRVVRIA